MLDQDHSENTDLRFRLVLKDTPESGEFRGSRLIRERSTNGPKKKRKRMQMLSADSDMMDDGKVVGVRRVCKNSF